MFHPGFIPCRLVRFTRKSIHTKTTSIFGNTGSAEFLAAAASPSSVPALHGLPEVIVTGRANVGKSTLLNAVLGRTHLLHTSKKAGRTQTLNYFRVGPPPGSLVVVDAPGYGARGRPEWGTLFEHVISTRDQLKRVYLLLNAKHGLNDADRAMLSDLSERCMSSGGTRWTLQAVVTKIDDVPLAQVKSTLQAMQKEIFEAAPACLPPIVTAAAKHPRLGIEEMRASIVDACGIGRMKVQARII